MKAKNWVLTLLLLLTGALCVFAGLMYWMDPLLHYGRENPVFTYYEYGEMYSNPGIAMHYDYDAVMVGTSMIENTSVDLCDELWGCKMVRLPYSGGTTYNMKTILDVCFESGNDIKTVYWELDEFQITGSATSPRYPLPDYLYRFDHKQDLSYLLNLDIFYHYGLNNVLGTLSGQISNAERRGETWLGTIYSKEQVLSGYHRPEPKTEKYEVQSSRMQEKADANLANIETLIQQHNRTEFVFFMPPFSVLYWDRELYNGTFDATMDSVIYVLEHLLKYDNVRIYFYQGETEIITNLDNYKDYSHYGPWINDQLTQMIAENKNLVTMENLHDYVNQFRDFIHSYNFDSIFSA